MKLRVLVAMVAVTFAACGGTQSQSSAADSPENLIPVGESALVGGWRVRVVGSTQGGSDLFGVKVTAQNLHDGSTTVAAEVSIRARTKTGGTAAPVTAGCSNALPVDQATVSDTTLEGFVCFELDSVDRNGLQLLVEAIDSKPPHRTYMATIGPEQDSGSTQFGPDELVEALKSERVNALVVASPYARGDYMQRAATVLVLCLDDQEASLFVYDTSAAAQSDAATIQPDGNPGNVSIDLYYGTLMWWAQGRVVVNYNLADTEIWESLTVAMGTPLNPSQTTTSKAPPDPRPASQLCPGSA